ncbi:MULTISPECIES: GtrA family protein [unclassified Roseitalea]|uniref:GtrA family protein n=1 Tax=unclassified Roseitalea TaxID=2639107 RepID=UPI00273D4A4F|nr:MULTISPECIES: GtrA family protein [unclassified Roseitalea]
MIAQLARFAGVGMAATLAHVATALIAQGPFGAPAQLANLTGFCAAVLVSYLGHGRLTFDANDTHGVRMPRFVAVALAGLAVSSAVTAIVHGQLGASFALAMALVAITVPALTFLGARFWAFARIDAPTGENWTGVALALAMATLFLSVFQGRYIHHDTAWYLVATRKWLEGAVLYTDIVEVNPPLNFYLTVPALWLADLVGLSDSDGQYLLVAILLAGVLIWVWRLIAEVPALAGGRGLLVLTGIGAAAIVPASDDIAQREHLLVLFILPWLVGHLTRAEPDRGAGAVARAAFAAIGICLKHYFVLFPVLMTLALVIRRRSLWPIVSPANLAILAICIAYVGMVGLRHPAYFDSIVPMALEVYGAYGLGGAAALAGMQLPLIAAFGLTIVIARDERAPVPGLDMAVAAVLAGAGVYLVQWTGFGYQAVPIGATVALGCVFVLARPGLPRKTAIAAAAGFVLAFLPALQNGTYKSPASEHFAPIVERFGPAPRLAVYSTSLSPSFPLALETGAQWTSRYPALWLVPGAVDGLADADCTAEPERCARLRAIGEETRAAIVDDALAGRPHVMIFDKQPFYFSRPGFDLMAFLAADPRFAALLADYATLEQTTRFLVLARKDR